MKPTRWVWSWVFQVLGQLGSAALALAGPPEIDSETRTSMRRSLGGAKKARILTEGDPVEVWKPEVNRYYLTFVETEAEGASAQIPWTGISKVQVRRNGAGPRRPLWDRRFLMVRWFLLMSTVALLTASSAQASVGQLTISVDGGIGVPVGNFTSEEGADAGMGFQFGGGVEYHVSPVFAVGLDGGYNRNAHSIEGTTEGEGETVASFDKDRFSTWHVGAHGTYLIPVTGKIVQPFLRLGLGIYSMSESWEYTYTDPLGNSSESGEEAFGSRLGGVFGVGANFHVTDTIGFGVGAEYTHIAMDEHKFYDSSASYLGFRGAVNYSILPK